MQKLNNILLNNQWVKQGITRKTREYFKVNEIEDTVWEILWGAARGVPRIYSYTCSSTRTCMRAPQTMVWGWTAGAGVGWAAESKGGETGTTVTE